MYIEIGLHLQSTYRIDDIIDLIFYLKKISAVDLGIILKETCTFHCIKLHEIKRLNQSRYRKKETEISN